MHIFSPLQSRALGTCFGEKGFYFEPHFTDDSQRKQLAELLRYYAVELQLLRSIPSGPTFLDKLYHIFPWHLRFCTKLTPHRILPSRTNPPPLPRYSKSRARNGSNAPQNSLPPPAAHKPNNREDCQPPKRLALKGGLPAPAQRP